MLLAICEKKLAVSASTGNYFRLCLILTLLDNYAVTEGANRACLALFCACYPFMVDTLENAVWHDWSAQVTCVRWTELN